MAAYAEGLNILKHANVGTAQREADAETAPLRDPEYYQYDLDLAGRRRGVAARQRDRVVAARPHRRRARRIARPRRLRRPRVRLRRGPLDDRSRRSTRACPRRCSRGALFERFDVAATARLRRQGPVGDAQGVRRARREGRLMGADAAVPSDALVFFGATGDLAYKKIFPALQSMVRHGKLDVPDRSAWRSRGWTARRPEGPRAQTASSEHGGVDERGVREAHRAAALRRRRLRRPGDVRRSCARSSATPSDPLHYLAIPPSLFATVVRGLGRSGCADGRARGRREAVRPRPRVGAGAQRDAALGLPGDERSSASTTTSARRRSRTSSTSASPTRSSSRSGTATTSRACRSRWPRTSACRAAGGSTRRSGAIRDVIQNHLLPGARAAGDGAAGRSATPRRCATRRRGC